MPNWKKVITSGSNAELNQLTASAFQFIGSGTAELEVQGHITASGNISSSATITAEGFAIGGIVAAGGIINDSGKLGVGVSNNITTQIGKNLTTPLKLMGHITASGNISASGFVTASGFKGDGSGITNVTATLPSGVYSSSLQTLGNITSSGNISASGTLISDGINSSGAVLPITSNGAALGSTSKQWSDLFLAEGGVINFDNGDVTITQTGNELAIAGGNLSVATIENSSLQLLQDGNCGIDLRVADTIDLIVGGNKRITVEEGGADFNGHITASGNISASGTAHTFGGTTTVTHISASSNSFVYLNKFDRSVNPVSQTYNSAGQGMGDVVYFGTGTLNAGIVYYLNSSLAWTELNATDDSAGADELLGVALGSDPSSDGVLLRGIVRLAGSPGSTDGAAVYASTSAGNLSQTAPNASGNIIRVCGYLTDNGKKQMWFNPDSTWVEKS